VITSVLRREPAGLARAVKGLFIAIVASTFAIATTKIVLTAVDDLSAGVVKFSTGTNIDGLGPRFALASSLGSITNPAALLLFSLVTLSAVVIVWAAMMIRKMLIVVAAVMTPLAFAGGAADITRSWVRRWIEFTAALIASKLILVVILMIGLSVFQGAGMANNTGAPHATQAGTQLATGSVLLLVAGLAPFIAIKMFHFAGDSLHSVHDQAQGARSAAQGMVAAPRKVSGVMSQGRSIGGNLSGAGQSPTVMSASGGMSSRGGAAGSPARQGGTAGRAATAVANGPAANGPAANGPAANGSAANARTAQNAATGAVNSPTGSTSSPNPGGAQSENSRNGARAQPARQS
jgi:type IV secretion system protein TrbL